MRPGYGRCAPSAPGSFVRYEIRQDDIRVIGVVGLCARHYVSSVIVPPTDTLRRCAEAALSEFAVHRPGWQSALMSVRITISGVSEDVRDRLAARAAQEHQTMQEFLRGALERIASRPSRGAWLQDVRSRKQVAGARVAAYRILDARDADRT